MVPWVKALAAHLDDVTLILRTHIVEEKLLGPPRVLWHKCTHTK